MKFFSAFAALCMYTAIDKSLAVKLNNVSMHHPDGTALS